MLQAVPSVLVAQQASGKQLMEVVINGKLVAAADGQGLRAFAMGPSGIIEQGRLFNVDKLQTLINATAVWQVASVLVAQKHLADISKKLEDIKKGVERISRFLDTQRKSRIRAVYDYAGQVYEALRSGEFPEHVEAELESCERDLIEIQEHLMAEFLQKSDARIQSSRLGTSETHKCIEAKVGELDQLAQDIAICLKTRIAAWHVHSLFPGNQHLKSARRKQIRESILRFAQLGPKSRDVLEEEIAAIRPIWYKKKAIASRKQSLSDRTTLGIQNLLAANREACEQLRMSELAMREADSSTRLLLQIENGAISIVEHRA